MPRRFLLWDSFLTDPVVLASVESACYGHCLFLSLFAGNGSFSMRCSNVCTDTKLRPEGLRGESL